MFTLLKVVGERARSPTTFVMITNQKCQLYRKMRKFSVLFMDIFGIPQKCTLIASYFTIFQYLTAISTIQYPALLSGIFVYSCTYK